MTYYIFFSEEEFKKNTHKKVFPEDRILGEIEFTNFWTQKGYKILKQLIEQDKKNILDNVFIVTSNYKKLSVEQFLDTIKSLKIIEQWTS